MRLLRMEVISSGLICMWCSGLLEGAVRPTPCATSLRSWSSRLRIEASRMELPTRRTMPPRMSGSTVLVSSTRWPVCSPMRSPICSTVSWSSSTALVTSTGSSLFSVVPQRVVAGAGCGRSPACGASRSAARGSSGPRVRPSTRLAQAVLLLLRGEVGREEEHRELAVLRERVGELAELLADDVELVRAPWRPRTASARRPGRSLPWPSCSAPPPDSAAKSSSRSASSTSLRWSSSVSVLRVTFSVARTVRSATSLRISWIARRVSASMSRRVCSSSSSRFSRACSRDSRSAASPALRARATISSACSRASFRRSRYSARIRRPPPSVRSAASIDSSIAFWRLSSASWIRGNANLPRTQIVAPNAISVQIISPTPGVTRKLPLSPLRLRRRA